VDLTKEEHLEMFSLIRDHIYCSCCELVEKLQTVCYIEYEEAVYHPCPQTVKELQDELESLESCEICTEDELDSMEERALEIEKELEEVEPREVMHFWLCSKYLAEHYGWAEMDVYPPVFDLHGVYVWACTYNGISDDWYLERLVEHICARRRANTGS